MKNLFGARYIISPNSKLLFLLTCKICSSYKTEHKLKQQEQQKLNEKGKYELQKYSISTKDVDVLPFIILLKLLNKLKTTTTSIISNYLIVIEIYKSFYHCLYEKLFSKLKF